MALTHNADLVDGDPGWYMFTYEVHSETTDKVYEVKLFELTQVGDFLFVAHFGCTCPHWIKGQKKDNKDRFCKHTRVIMRELEAQGRLAPHRGDAKRLAEPARFNVARWDQWRREHGAVPEAKLVVVQTYLDVPELDLD